MLSQPEKWPIYPTLSTHAQLKGMAQTLALTLMDQQIRDQLFGCVTA